MEIQDLPKNKKIVLFDGQCNLCNSSVQYIIKHDKRDVFRFAALQSDTGQNILKHIGIDTKNIDSIVLYEPGVAYFYKSGAAIEIANQLGGFLTVANLFRFIPQSLRNPLYDYVAKNRYKWYGRQDECMLPSLELKAKFV